MKDMEYARSIKQEIVVEKETKNGKFLCKQMKSSCDLIKV